MKDTQGTLCVPGPDLIRRDMTPVVAWRIEWDDSVAPIVLDVAPDLDSYLLLPDGRVVGEGYLYISLEDLVRKRAKELDRPVLLASDAVGVPLSSWL